MNTDYENSKAYFFKLSKDIIKIMVKDNVYLDEEDIIEMNRIDNVLMDGKKYFLILVSGKDTYISKEAREISASKEYSKNKHAQAIIATSLAHKIIINFFINIQKPPVKTQLFFNEKNAIEWINSIKKKPPKTNE